MGRDGIVCHCRQEADAVIMLTQTHSPVLGNQTARDEWKQRMPSSGGGGAVEVPAEPASHHYHHHHHPVRPDERMNEPMRLWSNFVARWLAKELQGTACFFYLHGILFHT